MKLLRTLFVLGGLLALASGGYAQEIIKEFEVKVLPSQKGDLLDVRLQFDRRILNQYPSVEIRAVLRDSTGAPLLRMPRKADPQLPIQYWDQVFPFSIYNPQIDPEYSFDYPLVSIGLPPGLHSVQLDLSIFPPDGPALETRKTSLDINIPDTRFVQVQVRSAKATDLRPDGETWDNRAFLGGKHTIRPDIYWALDINSQRMYYSPESTHKLDYDPKEDRPPYVMMTPGETLRWSMWDDDTFNGNDLLGDIEWTDFESFPFTSQLIDTTLPGLKFLRLETQSYRRTLGQIQLDSIGTATTSGPNSYTPLFISHQLYNAGPFGVPIQIRFLYPDGATSYGGGPVGMEPIRDWKYVADAVMVTKAKSGTQEFRQYGPPYRIAPDGRRLPLLIGLFCAPRFQQAYWLDTLAPPLSTDGPIPPSQVKWTLTTDPQTTAAEGVYLELGYRVPPVWSLGPKQWTIEPLLDISVNGAVLETATCPQDSQRANNGFAGHLRQGYGCYYIPFHRLPLTDDLRIRIVTELERTPDSSGLTIYRGDTVLRPDLSGIPVRTLGFRDLKVKKSGLPSAEVVARWQVIKDGDTLATSDWVAVQKGKAKWGAGQRARFRVLPQEGFKVVWSLRGKDSDYVYREVSHYFGPASDHELPASAGKLTLKDWPGKLRGRVE